ncbi:MAG: ABC transporter substrate-binding protein [Inquilinus limosus]|uniref:ABC transporter substrate-binding protein n=1 Tax=Inquilinus limosus TaxID=171674 RepID=A0A952FK94_9PROT|nr:ABC transporter substrate-binding protein [Inquilinus limosus]
MFGFVSRRAAAALVLALVTGAGPGLAQTLDLSPEQPGRLRAEKDSAIAATIPKDFRFAEDGVLTVAVAPGQPPIATYATDARTVIGADPDLAQLVADLLGLKLKLVAVAWADWPLGLASGRYDAVISNVGVTEERKQRFDFSSYRKGLHGFYVKSSSPIASLKEPKDIAGLRIITSSGTNQERILLEWDRQNVARGLAPAELQYYDDQAAWGLAIQAGRADALFSVNASLAYQARDGSLKPVGTVSSGWPLDAETGITTRRGSGLADAFTAAINALIADGKYAGSLARWNLSAEAIDRSRTNPPGLPKF